MKRLWILLAILFQLAALAWIAVDRELIVANGQILYLRTAPIDPRDIFRGDFVRLDYDASRFGARELDPQMKAEGIRKGQVVYAPLSLDSRGLARVEGLSATPPRQGLYLRGHALNPVKASKRPALVQVKYGIEQYFVEQGKGKQMEQRRGQRSGIQTPLEMKLAVDGRGRAVITGHRWSPLGIGLGILRRVERDPLPGQRSAVIELTLENTSHEPLALVLPPDLCSIRLEPVKSAPRDLLPQRPSCPQKTVDPAHLQLLQPGEQRKMVFDFNKPPWLLEMDGKMRSIGSLPWGQRYRLVYRSPEPGQLEGVAGSEAVWQGFMPSRAFHGRGQVD